MAIDRNVIKLEFDFGKTALADEVYINIGATWKKILSTEILVSGAWKAVTYMNIQTATGSKQIYW